MSLEEAKLSLKQRTLSSVPMGAPFLDHVAKLILEPQITDIRITRIIVFDGMSLRSFDPSTGFRNRMTIRNQGKVSQSPGENLMPLVGEGVDAVGKIVGIGSVLQFGKIGFLVAKHTKLVAHDGARRFEALLKQRGELLGKAIYTINKYHSLRKLPDSLKALAPEDEVRNRPILVTKANVEVDLRNAPVNRNGLVQIRLGDNIDTGKLSRDHGRDVVVTAYHDISIVTAGANMPERYTGRLSLNLGPFDFETIRVDRGQ